MRTYDYDRRAKKIDFMQSDEMTLAKLKGFVSEIREAPLFYVQVKKVLDKEDKPLPENASVPEDPADLCIWQGHEEGCRQRDLLKTWLPMNTEIVPLSAES